MQLRRKRAYDTADTADAFRVLADRLWPRGVSKERGDRPVGERRCAQS